MKHRIFPIVFLLLVGLGLHLWNNDVPAIPAALARVVPGQTTVREFMAIAGARCRKAHSCTCSELMIALDGGSTAHARSRMLVAIYHGPNSRGPTETIHDAEDGDCLITRVKVYEWCRLDDTHDGRWARILAALSDWDRSLVAHWRTEPD